MFPDFWLDRPYYSLDAYCKNKYGFLLVMSHLWQDKCTPLLPHRT